MAPRANWKGYLKLALVTCPIALYPASTNTDKNPASTGKTPRRATASACAGSTRRRRKEVDNEDIIKGYEIAKGQFVRVTPEELEAIEIELTRTINIDEFVPPSEIDDLNNIRPYYIAPEGKIGAEAFLSDDRETIAATGKVAIGRIVLSTREHMIALEPRGKGLMATLLRYPYEVRDEREYRRHPPIKIDKEMIDLAKHIVQSKAGHFEPEKFEDQYEKAVGQPIKRKAAGQEIKPARREEPSKSST